LPVRSTAPPVSSTRVAGTLGRGYERFHGPPG
jgi:hypothetical protein